LENLGMVYVATVGQQAAAVVGELWVSYEIDLIRPKLFETQVANLGLSNVWALNLTSPTAASNYTANNWTNMLFASPGAPGGNSGVGDMPVSLLPTGTTPNGFQFAGWLAGVVRINLDIYMSGTPGTISWGNGPAIVGGPNVTSQATVLTPVGWGGFTQNVSYGFTIGGSNACLRCSCYIQFTGQYPGNYISVLWGPWSSIPSTGSPNIVGVAVTMDTVAQHP
jgi:hypothetical protein